MTLTPTLQRLERIWKTLTRPAPGLVNREEREVAYLLSSVELALLPAGAVILPLWYLSSPDFHALNWIIPIFGGLLMASYVLGRGRRYRLGAYALLVSLYFTIISVVLTATGPLAERMLVLDFLITTMLLGSLLLPMGLLLVNFAVVVLSVVAFFFVPTAPVVTTFSTLVSVTVTSLLIVLITQLRRSDLRRLKESERPYYALFEQSHDAVFLLGLNGVHIKVNRRASEMLGYTPEEIAGLSFRDIVMPGELSGSESVLDRLKLGEQVPMYERTFRKKDGTPIPVEISVELVRDSAGHPLHIQSVVRDLTERKQHEAALRESEAYQRAIIANAPFGSHFYHLDGANRLVFEEGNPAADRILGIQHDSLVGQDIEYTFPKIETAVIDTLKRIAASGVEQYHNEADFEVNSEPVSIEVHAFQTVPGRLAVFLNDITTRKRAALALQQSEERFSSAFRNSPVPMIIVCVQGAAAVGAADGSRPNRTFIDANDAFLRLVGYSWDELAGRAPVEMGIAIPCEDRERRLKLLDTQRGYPASEAHIRTRSGDIRNVLISAQRTMMGGQWCDIEILVDTTALSRAQDALRESEAQLKSIMESMQEMVWSVSLPEDRIRYANPYMVRTLGMPAIPVQGDPSIWQQHILTEDELQVTALTRDLMSQGQGEAEFRIMRPDGNLRWLHVRTWLVRDAVGTPVRADGLATDITERKLAQEQAFALAVERERVRVLVRFVQSASHELRTPLSTIGTSVYLLTHHPDPDRRQIYADQITHQIARLSQLIDRLLVMTELDNATPFEYKPIDLNGLAQRCVDGVKNTVDQKEMRLDFAPTPGLPRLWADWDWLEQALDGIVDNAVRYAPEGGAVLVRTYARENRLVIEVKDDGPGIHENDLPHIFERFWRADEAHSTPGFGLGLPIAQEVIQRHGGQIEIDSAPGQGSTFRVVLPITPPQSPFVTSV